MSSNNNDRVHFRVAIAAARAQMEVLVEQFVDADVEPSDETNAVIEQAVESLLKRLGWTSRSLSEVALNEMMNSLQQKLEEVRAGGDEDYAPHIPADCPRRRNAGQDAVRLQRDVARARKEPEHVGLYL